MLTLPIAGTAMPILDTTTCTIACLAALADSPNLFPFSSVTGIPYFNSLEETKMKLVVEVVAAVTGILKNLLNDQGKSHRLLL